MTFTDLNLSKPLLNALADQNFTEPTTIQAKAFSVIMSGRDVVGIAQTGTGKTLAFLLPCLRLWKFSTEKHPQIVILVPTRELVIQVVAEIEKLTQYMNVQTVGVYGGKPLKPQADLVSMGLDIIVGTPGRLLDLVLNGALKLKFVKRLVIDEVDEMLDLGFRAQLTSIFELMPAKRQNILFSATMNETVEAVIDDFFNSPEVIEAAPVGTPLSSIDQMAYQVPNFHTKVNLLIHLLEDANTYKKVLVFANTKKLADEIFDEIEGRFDDEVGIIHSGKDQNFRFRMVRNFHSGDLRVLIATDIIARGLDISEVSHVINFDVPDEAETYIHRIGRTGRYDKTGHAITFIVEKENDYIAAIETLMDMSIPRHEMPESVPVSKVLTPDEMPLLNIPNVFVKQPKIDLSNSAFHKRSEKNSKVNVKVRHEDKMWEKYGKPKTRGDKKKKK
jgi:ATP-dependent RNA helicase RhlE